jgi:signal transduction histidine kinase
MFSLFLSSCYFTAFLSLVMGVFIFFKNRRAKINWLWSGVSLMTAVWSFSLAKIITADSAQTAIIWNWVLYWAAVFIPVLFFHFVVVLIGEEKKYSFSYDLLYLFTLILLFLIPTKYFVAGASPKAGFAFWLDPGPFLYFYVLSFAICVSWSFWLLYKTIKKTSGIKKYQLTYVFYCGLFGFGGALTDFFPQFFNIYPFGHFLVLFYVVFIAYAITRYRLLDIRTIIRRSSVFTFLVAIVAILFAVFSNLLLFIFEGYLGLYAQLASAILSAAIVVFFYEPIKRNLELFTDKFLFVKSYNSAQVFSDINKLALSEINLDRLLDSIIKKLGGIFYFKRIAFLLLDDKQKLRLTKNEGFDRSVIESFAKGKEKVLPLYFNGNKSIWVIPELKIAYDSGEYVPKRKDVLLGLDGMEVNLVIPLFVKEELIGIVLVGNKKSDSAYSQEDLNTLMAIAGQLAMAAQNARLYEKQKQFNVKLKEEVKKATAKLEAANKELQRLDDAKSEFLSIASHQLRTPTTIIKGYISMMQEGSFGKIPKVVKENLDKVFIATERLLNLIESLLDISRIEAGRLEFEIGPVDLTKIAEELKEEFEPKAKERKLKIAVYYPKGLPVVSADAQKVKEVASNLVDNAVKYTKKGEVSIDIHQEGSSVVFVVSDTGMGIASEDVGRLFNKFVRGQGMTTVHPGGTGLGLYFARVVIENLGGRIWAESVGKGKGSKFSFSLPLLDKKKAPKIKSIAK